MESESWMVLHFSSGISQHRLKGDTFSVLLCQVMTGPGLAHVWGEIGHDLFAVFLSQMRLSLVMLHSVSREIHFPVAPVDAMVQSCPNKVHVFQVPVAP